MLGRRFEHHELLRDQAPWCSALNADSGVRGDINRVEILRGPQAVTQLKHQPYQRAGDYVDQYRFQSEHHHAGYG